MKRCIIGGLLLAAGFAGAEDSLQRVERPQPPRKIGTETPAQFADRTRWFVGDRFGMFIHFGLYTMPAWHEWIKTRRVVTEEKYQEYFDNFNPDLFDAREWVRKAKSAGMKYIVLTSKHHEGFCLWDTKFTDYKITNTPFGRDLVREFVDACHAEGMRVGFYYSLLDWHHPDFTVDPIHPRRPKGEKCWDGVGTNEKGYAELNAGRDMRRYAQYMKDQITELLTNYGKIDLLWYDFSYPDRGKCWVQWDSVALLELTRRLQPGIIVNDRLDLSDTDGGWDFVTVEQTKADSWPMRNGRRAMWETCQTFSGSWGYARDEKSWKTPEELVGLLVETVSKGGNLILNVGPTGRGDFDYRANDRLESMGCWMRWNSRAVYGCTKAPEEFAAPEGCVQTWNEQTRRLYLTVERYPTNGVIKCAYADKIVYAQLLHDASEIAIENGALQLPKDRPNQILPVVELKIRTRDCACGAPCTTDWKSTLPRPIFEEHPQLVDLYEKAWELAHDHIRVLPGLPSPRHMDEALWDDRVWIWDTCFMVQFCKYAPREFPGVESLENFYGVMLADKAMPLPRVKCDLASTGRRGETLDFYIHHPDNPPIFAWTEYKYALQTGDRMRLERVYAKNRWLQRWYELFESFDPAAPQPHGSICKVALKRVEHGYRWKGCPNGMDNTPRGRTPDCPDADVRECPNNPDLLWVDAIAQQGLSALHLAKIADLLGRPEEAKAWQGRYEALKAEVNALYWDEADGAYYDILSRDLSKVRVLTPASFWPALAGMPTPERMSRMAAHLRNPDTLGGEMPTPSVARNDRAFDPKGGYWRGGVWMPTTYMTVKALDAYGDFKLAREISRKVLERMYRTYASFEPHTIWECYSPTEDKPSTDKVGEWSRPDFCGWSALGPISLFLEDVIGIKEADAFRNTLTCDFERDPKGRVGVANYRFGQVVCSVIADAKTIRVTANRPFTLIADGVRHEVKTGENAFRR